MPVLTAYENAEMVLALQGVDIEERRQRVERILKDVGLEGMEHRRPDELSGGQQQRVAVARALASRPTIIFADEPTGNLDSNSGSEILHFMRDAVDEFGQTIVMVTHDPYAAAYGDRTVFLADGSFLAGLVICAHSDTRRFALELLREPGTELADDVARALVGSLMAHLMTFGEDREEIASDLVEVFTLTSDFQSVKEELENNGIALDSAEISMIPKSLTELGEKDTIKAMILIDALEELEDVQQVSSNLNITDEIMVKYDEWTST